GARAAEVASAAATLVAIAALGWALAGLLRGMRPKRLVPPLIVVTVGAILSLVAYIAFVVHCPGGGCRARDRSVLAGVDPWSSGMHAWQWAAELALATTGLVAASLALALAVRGRPGVRPALLGAH